MVSFKNNGKLKLLIIVGTRPEIIRLAAVINKCRKYFDCILAHTGQNYDYNLNGVFFKDLKLADPEVYLDAVGEDLGATMGNIIDKSYKLMVQLKPDAVLVLGDTNSCLSVIGAKRLHIPIFHMEAGNRCFDECLPEETNRRIVDIISDVNICYSEHARRYLNASGAMLHDGWAKINDTWYFFKNFGGMAEGWVKDGNTWYYLQPGSGKMVTGWNLINGKYYYFDASGAMLANTTTPDGYKVDASGAWVK